MVGKYDRIKSLVIPMGTRMVRRRVVEEVSQTERRWYAKYRIIEMNILEVILSLFSSDNMFI